MGGGGLVQEMARASELEAAEGDHTSQVLATFFQHLLDSFLGHLAIIHADIPHKACRALGDPMSQSGVSSCAICFAISRSAAIAKFQGVPSGFNILRSRAANPLQFRALAFAM